MLRLIEVEKIGIKVKDFKENESRAKHDAAMEFAFYADYSIKKGKVIATFSDAEIDPENIEKDFKTVKEDILGIAWKNEKGIKEKVRKFELEGREITVYTNPYFRDSDEFYSLLEALGFPLRMALVIYRNLWWEKKSEVLAVTNTSVREEEVEVNAKMVGKYIAKSAPEGFLVVYPISPSPEGIKPVIYGDVWWGGADLKINVSANSVEGLYHMLKNETEPYKLPVEKAEEWMAIRANQSKTFA